LTAKCKKNSTNARTWWTRRARDQAMKTVLPAKSTDGRARPDNYAESTFYSDPAFLPLSANHGQVQISLYAEIIHGQKAHAKHMECVGKVHKRSASIFRLAER